MFSENFHPQVILLRSAGAAFIPNLPHHPIPGTYYLHEWFKGSIKMRIWYKPPMKSGKIWVSINGWKVVQIELHGKSNA